MGLNDNGFSTRDELEILAEELYNAIQTGETTANDLLELIKLIDGSGSGLNADLLDGQHGSYYAAASLLTNYVEKVTGYGLSQNDFTDTLKSKLESYVEEDVVYVDASLPYTADDTGDGSYDSPYFGIKKAIDTMAWGAKRVIILKHTNVPYIVGANAANPNGSDIDMSGKTIVIRSEIISSVISNQPNQMITIRSKHYKTFSSGKVLYGKFVPGNTSCNIFIKGYIILDSTSIDFNIKGPANEDPTEVYYRFGMFCAVFGNINLSIDHEIYYYANLTTGGNMSGTDYYTIFMWGAPLCSSHGSLGHISFSNRGSKIWPNENSYLIAEGTAKITCANVDTGMPDDTFLIDGLNYKGTSDQPTNVIYNGLDLSNSSNAVLYTQSSNLNINRSTNVTYTNTTNSLLFLSISARTSSTDNFDIIINVNGTPQARSYINTPGSPLKILSLFAVVPEGGTYSFEVGGGTLTDIVLWREITR